MLTPYAIAVSSFDASEALSEDSLSNVNSTPGGDRVSVSSGPISYDFASLNVTTFALLGFGLLSSGVTRRKATWAIRSTREEPPDHVGRG